LGANEEAKKQRVQIARIITAVNMTAFGGSWRSAVVHPCHVLPPGTISMISIMREPVEKVGPELMGRRRTIETRSFWSIFASQTARVRVKGTLVEGQNAFFNRLGRF